MKSIKRQIEEALIEGFSFLFADAGWGFAAKNIGAEPTELPLSQENCISFRFMAYNRHTTDTSDTYDSEATITDVDSVIRLQSYGPLAFIWLGTFLDSLGDDETLEFFRPLGFTVDPAAEGIADISAMLGSEEQLRGTSMVSVSCRSIRDRVITLVDTVTVDLSVADPTGAHDDLTSSFSIDVSETP